jgi:hypothetical protein|tara:strand:- start:647 stop:898 length:252 start_codon:yes stop_codon:yes gene_type:complete
MKTVKLTHNQTGKQVVVNWDNVLFAAETANNFGDSYVEVAYPNQTALPVKETIDQISDLLEADEAEADVVVSEESKTSEAPAE